MEATNIVNNANDKAGNIDNVRNADEDAVKININSNTKDQTTTQARNKIISNATFTDGNVSIFWRNQKSRQR